MPYVPLTDAGPPDYTERYNTPLSPADELAYQNWAQIQSAVQKRDVSRDNFDYDMRGAFQSGAAQAPNGHYPDTFKKPNHPSFSDQSQYHGVDGNQGGSWQQMGGQWYFTPGAANLQMHGAQGLQDYFRRSDPTVQIIGLPSPQPVSMQDHVRQQLANAAAPSTDARAPWSAPPPGNKLQVPPDTMTDVSELWLPRAGAEVDTPVAPVETGRQAWEAEGNRLLRETDRLQQVLQTTRKGSPEFNAASRALQQNIAAWQQHQERGGPGIQELDRRMTIQRNVPLDADAIQRGIDARQAAPREPLPYPAPQRPI